MVDEVEAGAKPRFAGHWLTIQPSLFDFLEDEVGELDDNQRLFVRIAEGVEDFSVVDEFLSLQ